MPTVPPKSFEHNPIFTVSAFLGLFPFEKGPTFGLDKLLFVYSFVFAAAVTLIGGLSMLDDLTPLLTESYNQAIILAYIGGLILVFPCSLTCAFLKRDVLQQTFRALKEIQSTFEKIRLSKFNKLTHLLPLFDISVPLLCTLLTYVTNSNIPGTAYGTFNGLTLMGMALICGQLSFLVDLIGDIFDAGIDFLNEMKLSLIIKRHSKRISELVKATNKLGSASCSLNEVYSDQILVMMSLCFCGFSIHLYYISMLASLPDGFKFDLLLPQVYSVLFYCYVSWRVNQSSAETSGKSKEFNTLLYQLMIDDKTNEILNNGVSGLCGQTATTVLKTRKQFPLKNKLRLHISMKREVVFTACGFFNLDYTLVHSMIASATTYLVILIQFGKPETVDQQPPASTAMTNFTTSQLYL